MFVLPLVRSSPTFSHNFIHNPLIGFIQPLVVYALDINIGSAGGGVPQPLADDGHIGIAVIGQACPAVTRDIGREFMGDSRQTSQFLQLTVVIGQPVAVLPIGFFGRLFGEYGKEIVRLVRVIATDDFQGARRKLEAYLLVGLPTLVSEIPILAELRLAEEGNINKRNATGEHTKQEDVAYPLERTAGTKRYLLQLPDFGDTDGTLVGPGIAGIAVLEGLEVGDILFFHGLVVDRPKRTHVTRDGVHADAGGLEPTLITGNQGGSQILEQQVLPFQETLEGMQSGAIVGSGTETSFFPNPGYLLRKIFGQRG